VRAIHDIRCSDVLRGKTLRRWIFGLLRYAITHETEDQAAALAIADELDVPGPPWRETGFHFFVRTTNEVCRAVVSVDDQEREAILRKFVARIADRRLARAFEVAAEIQPRDEPPLRRANLRKSPGMDLWRGLVPR
jgi:hypothetical protein